MDGKEQEDQDNMFVDLPLTKKGATSLMGYLNQRKSIGNYIEDLSNNGDGSEVPRKKETKKYPK